MILIPVSTYQPSKSWPFTYHMCAYLLQITVVQCNTQTSNDVNYFKIFYVVVIMLIGQLQDFLIRYNQNSIVEIYLCLLRVLHWNILLLLPKTNINSTTPSHQCHAMFHSFYLMIAKRMLPLLMHTENIWFHCSMTKKYWQHHWF